MLEFSFSADGIAGLLYTLCEARWTAAEDANFAHLQQWRQSMAACWATDVDET